MSTLDRWHDVFTKAFYEAWDVAGPHDTDSPAPWGMPWLHGHALYATESQIAGRDPGDAARAWWRECREEIAALVADESGERA